MSSGPRNQASMRPRSTLGRNWKGNTAPSGDLQAAIGEHEVTNPFMVTEVYIKESGKWKLAELTFSHLLRPVKMNSNKN
jgi:hypothetical protein